MKQIFLLLPVLLVLIGCGKSTDEQFLETKRSADAPLFILTMPDGRNLYRITVANNFSSNDHFVYFFSTNDTKTISVNYSVPQGKTHVNRTIVVDGVTYKAVETNN